MWVRTGKNSAAAKARQQAGIQLAGQIAGQLARLLVMQGLAVPKQRVLAGRFRRGWLRRKTDNGPEMAAEMAAEMGPEMGPEMEAVLECWADLCWQKALASGWPEPPSGAQLLAVILDQLAERAGAPAGYPAAWPVLLAASGQVGWLRPESRERLRARLARQGLLLVG